MNSARNYIFGKKYTNLLMGLISYWKLDGNLLDSHSTHNGTATSISYAAGISNNGITFTGTGQKADFGSSTDFQFSDGVSTDYPFSISYWVKYTVTVGDNLQFRKDNGGFVSYTGSNGLGMRFIISSNSSFTNYHMLTTGNFITTGVWYNIVKTYDGSKSTSGMKIYVNGSLVSTTPTSVGTYTCMNNSGISNVYIYSSISSARYIADEMAMWNRALTAGEAAQIYNSGAGRFYPF